jgi:hypothetical protein
MNTLHDHSHRFIFGSLALLAAMASLNLMSPVFAQPCNPVIDGTYCAEQLPRQRVYTTSRPPMKPIENIGSAISAGSDTPGTLGGIMYRGDGTNCIGLLRRGTCK